MLIENLISGNLQVQNSPIIKFCARILTINKMKKVIYSFLMLGLSVFILTACEQSADLAPSSDANLSTRIISAEEVDFIGNQHNEILAKVFSKYNWESNDFEAELIKRFKEEDIMLDLNKERIDNFTKQGNQYSFEKELKFLQNGLSSNSNLLLEEIMVLSDDFDSYNSLLDKIPDLQIKIKNSSESFDDKNALLVTLGVLKSSAYFWMPISKGGSGIGYSVLEKINNARINRNVNAYGAGDGEVGGGGTICFSGWKTTLRGDAISAGSGMIGVAVVMSTPGGVIIAEAAAAAAAVGITLWPIGVAALVGVASYAAYDSGWAAFKICEEK